MSLVKHVKPECTMCQCTCMAADCEHTHHAIQDITICSFRKHPAMIFNVGKIKKKVANMYQRSKLNYNKSSLVVFF